MQRRECLSSTTIFIHSVPIRKENYLSPVILQICGVIIISPGIQQMFGRNQDSLEAGCQINPIRWWRWRQIQADMYSLFSEQRMQQALRLLCDGMGSFGLHCLTLRMVAALQVSPDYLAIA